jgi:hypothetical protein
VQAQPLGLVAHLKSRGGEFHGAGVAVPAKILASRQPGRASGDLKQGSGVCSSFEVNQRGGSPQRQSHGGTSWVELLTGEGWQGGQVGAGRDAEVPQVGVELEEAAAGRSGVRRRLVLVASSRRMEWTTPAHFEWFFAAALRASRMGTLGDDSDARRSCSWWRAMWWNDRSMVAEECTEQSGAGGRHEEQNGVWLRPTA